MVTVGMVTVGMEGGEEPVGATTAIPMSPHTVTDAIAPCALQRLGDGAGVVCGSAAENRLSRLRRGQLALLEYPLVPIGDIAHLA